MNPSATIKLFLPFGDPNKVRTAEISNWSGKAVAAPRTDLDHLLARPEVGKPGVYMLLGADPNTNSPAAYIGEAEVVGDRIKQHRSKEFWNSAIAFVSKDDNLTRAHIRYLEGRIIVKATEIGRYALANFTPSGSRLPESDLHEMEVFLEGIAQLLPVLGSSLLSPVVPNNETKRPMEVLYCTVHDIKATGFRSPNGFVVLSGSQAVVNERDGTKTHGAWILAQRDKLLEDGSLARRDDKLIFTRDVEFASPSAAAAVVRGGNAPGPSAWKDSQGRTLKELESVS